jgi:hypothetical protein
MIEGAHTYLGILRRWGISLRRTGKLLEPLIRKRGDGPLRNNRKGHTNTAEGPRCLVKGPQGLRLCEEVA